MQFLRVLVTDWEGASPEARFFLAALIQKYGCDLSEHLKADELSRILGISTNAVRKATAFLVARGYLKKERVTGAVGRPSNKLIGTEKLRIHLGTESISVIKDNIPIIERLLSCNKCFGDLKGQKGQSLNLSNRFLLAVLILHSDEGGVVDSLGFSQLSKMTGMKKDRLHSQFSKLISLGYIRNRVAGFTERYLFGKVETLYYLNLRHTAYEHIARPGVTVCTKWKRGICPEVEVRNILYAKRRSGIYGASYDQIEIFLGKKHSDNLLWFFQAKLMSYARKIFFRFSGQRTGMLEGIDEQIFGDILLDITPRNTESIHSKSMYSIEEQYKFMAHVIYRSASHLAAHFCDLMKVLIDNKVFPVDCDYRFLPVRHDVGDVCRYLAVEVYFGRLLPICILLKDGDCYESVSTQHEYDMSKKERKKYGLMH